MAKRYNKPRKRSNKEKRKQRAGKNMITHIDDSEETWDDMMAQSKYEKEVLGIDNKPMLIFPVTCVVCRGVFMKTLHKGYPDVCDRCRKEGKL